MSKNLQSLEINCTKNTPDIIADVEKGELIISGNIINASVLEVFAPINEWIDLYLNAKIKVLKIILDIELFSTSASLCITDLIIRLNKIYDQDKLIEFYWHYPADDEFLYEDGEDFQQLAKFPFSLVEK